MTVSLPPHLLQRLHPDAPAPRTGRYVVYWMRMAARASENPALDVALVAAQQLGLPVFVYHALAEGYRYASDRHHTFILEGARDVQAQLGLRDIGYAFHLECPGSRGEHLLTLARDAALVVTEDVPVAPLLEWTRSLRAHCPVWEVDAHAVAPFRRGGRTPLRAFEFRKETEPVWNLAGGWRDVEPSGPAWLPALPFTPVDLSVAELPKLVAGCDIDHGIAPVTHTVGGTRAALERWNAYLETALDRYAAERDDPLSGVNSRMSAYLHYGHVSPFRLLRDARARGGEGAKKFLDELLVWRELAWAFCAFEPRHETLDALPEWASQSLEAHRGDPRPRLFSYEQLARAQTGEPLWDAAQRSLLHHGELHNAVRMTWGKQVLQWTRSPAEALATLIDLNHRYALDGRDPASYGGILWCFGAFDRSFSPEQPITGVVRSRPIAQYGKRIDVAEYGRRMRLPARGTPRVIAVVGAGVAGSSAARALSDAGHTVRLFDDGLSRVSTHEKSDDGAQYFTVKDPRFGRWVRAWRDEGLIAKWSPRLSRPSNSQTPWWVATPAMETLLQRLQVDLDVQTGVKVDAMSFGNRCWSLKSGPHALGDYDAVVLAVPPVMAAALVPEVLTTCATVKAAPCWSVTATFDSDVFAPFDVWQDELGAVAWAARESSKPGRAAELHWVLHASSGWSRQFAAATPEEVGPALVKAFFLSAGLEPREAVSTRAKFWPFARVETAVGEPCLFEPGRRLAVCGDWLLGPRIEAAYLSGQAAAGRLLSMDVGDEPGMPELPRKASQMSLL